MIQSLKKPCLGLCCLLHTCENLGAVNLVFPWGAT